MQNIIYLVRHANTTIEENVPVSKWRLSEKGRFQAEKLATKKEFKKLHILISSDKEKAYDTALPLSRKLKRPIDRFRALRELNQDKGGFLPKETFDFAVKYALRNPDKSKYDWERASIALTRFQDKIDEIDLAYSKRKILIVAHGLVINLYLANILGKMHEVYERTMKSRSCSWAKIKDRKVIKDII